MSEVVETIEDSKNDDKGVETETEEVKEVDDDYNS